MMPQFPINVYTGDTHLCIADRSAYEELLKEYTYIRAAGGWVTNKNGEVLMIFRRGKWDLPKGKVENGELDEQAAVREVAEETGVQAEISDSRRISTWHTYDIYGEKMLKETVWFTMQAVDGQHLAPQEEEDIERAVWVPYEEVFRRLNDSYPTLGDLAREMQQGSLQ